MRNLPVLRSGVAAALLCLTVAAHAQYAQPRVPSVPSVVTVPAAPAPAATSQPTRAPQAEPVDSILVVVNNDVITRRELINRSRQVEKRLTSQGVALPPRTQLQKQLLERMIVERAQAQMAKESGINIDDATVDRAISRIAEQNKLSQPEFRMQLERDGMTYADFREDIRREILAQRLREREVDNKIQISESEVDNYLAAQNSQTAQEIDIAQILIRTPENASPEQLAQRRERAEDVLRQLKTGADFSKTAATYSDSNDAMGGGDLGWRSAERLPELFVTSVANLQPGQISPLLKSSNGFHILKLLGRRSAAAETKASAPAVQQTHVRHILIKVNQVVSAAEARRKLVELKDRLDHNAATFEELAKLYSNDLSASKGGDLGWIYPGDTVPEFERAMDQLKPGQVSDPVESPFGFHLIQVLERKTDDASRERQRAAARAAIRERKLDEATEDWIRQLRDRAYVEYRFDQD